MKLYSAFRNLQAVYSRAALPLLLILLVLLCLARAYGGLYGVMSYPHDVFALLGPAWKVLNGQKPHIDFYSQLGPVPYLETALGLILSHNQPAGLVYGQVMSGFLISIWTHWLARTRFSSPFYHLLSLYVLLLAIAPLSLGETFASLSVAMSYNRLGYGLTIVILVEALAPTRNGSLRSGFPGGLSTGAAIAILLFTKITFFFGAIFLLIALAFVRPQTRSRWVGMALGFCGVCLAFLAYLNFDLRAILSDFRISAGAKRLAPTKLLAAAFELLSGEGLSVAAFVFVSCFVLRAGDSGRTVAQLALAGIAVLLAGAFLLFGNYQDRELPLNACFAMFLAGLLLRNWSSGKPEDRIIRSGLILWAVLLATGPIVSELSATWYMFYERWTGAIRPLSSPGLATLRIGDADYAELVESGLTLANQYRGPADTIVSLDFTDFFPYALRIPPPSGGAFCLHYRSSFSDRSHPEPERLFGSATIVMVPMRFSQADSQLSIPRIYGPYLMAHYHLEATSTRWRLYRRNTGIPVVKWLRLETNRSVEAS